MNTLNRIGKVCLVLVAVLVSVSMCEAFLRWIDYNYSPLRITTIKKYSEWRYFHSFEDRHFIYDPYLLWRPRKAAPFNSQGYRGSEITASKTPASIRIFAIGDSNTLGWYGEKDANWPMYLQEILREQDDRFTVVNAGVSGYSSFQGLRRLKEALPFQPDMVLISFGANDAMRVTVSDAEFASRKIRSLKLDRMLLKLRTGQLLLSFSDKGFSREKQGLVPRVSLQEYRENLNEIIKLSQERNIKVVLLTRPFRGESPNEWWWTNFASAYNSAVMQVAESKQVPVIDIYAYFKGKEEYFIDESHFTEEGYRVMARIIFENVGRLLGVRKVAAARAAR